METNGTLVPFAWIEDGMHRFAGIDGAGLGCVHLNQVGRFNFATVRVEVLRDNAIILDLEAANRGRHPTVLVAVVVDGADLAHLPADGHEFKSVGLDD